MNRLLVALLCDRGFHVPGYTRVYEFVTFAQTEFFCRRCGKCYRTAVH